MFVPTWLVVLCVITQVYTSCRLIKIWWNEYIFKKWSRQEAIKAKAYNELWVQWDEARLKFGYEYACKHFPLRQK